MMAAYSWVLTGVVCFFVGIIAVLYVVLTPELRRRLEVQWIAERNTEPPQAQGPRIANALRAAGVNAVLFQWPSAAPVKAGVDWLLEQRERAAA